MGFVLKSFLLEKLTLHGYCSVKEQMCIFLDWLERRFFVPIDLFLAVRFGIKSSDAFLAWRQNRKA